VSPVPAPPLLPAPAPAPARPRAPAPPDAPPDPRGADDTCLSQYELVELIPQDGGRTDVFCASTRVIRELASDGFAVCEGKDVSSKEEVSAAIERAVPGCQRGEL